MADLVCVSPLAAVETASCTLEGAPPAKRPKTSSQRRSKRTRPKLRGEETPPQRSCANLELCNGIRSTATQESDDEDPEENTRDFNLGNYRRFSARSRKKTDFYSVGKVKGQVGSTLEGSPTSSAANVTQKRTPVLSVRRSLFTAKDGANSTEDHMLDPFPPEIVEEASEQVRSLTYYM